MKDRTMQPYLPWHEKIRIPNYFKEEHIRFGWLEFALEKCTGCKMCAKICPSCTLEVVNKKVKMVDDLPQCIACGDCMAICPENVIHIHRPMKLNYYYKTLNKGELSLPRLFSE